MPGTPVGLLGSAGAGRPRLYALETLAATLGPPLALREISDGGPTLAAVGRWRHRGAAVDLTDTDAVHLVFNVSGGQRIELRVGGRAVRGAVRAGSIGVLFPGRETRVTVAGAADTVQIVITAALIEAVTGRPALRALPPSPVLPRRLQALAAHALVALDAFARGRARGAVDLDVIARGAAAMLAQPPLALAPDAPSAAVARFVGGLSAAARGRVRALLDARLAADPCEPPSVAELAAAAGLSVPHFSRAFRASEGEPPHARVHALQLQHALGLLLRPDARVDDVGGRTGFSSASHFVRSFRRHVGATPGAVRNAAGRDAATWPAAFRSAARL